MRRKSIPHALVVAQANTYTCPAGKILRHQGARDDRKGITRHVYRARVVDCRDCAFRKQCCLRVSARTIVRKESVLTIAAYLAKMQTEAAQEIYRLRGAVAEFPDAWLKTKIGLRQFCRRGLKKVIVKYCGLASPTTFSNGSGFAGKHGWPRRQSEGVSGRHNGTEAHRREVIQCGHLKSIDGSRSRTEKRDR